MTDIQYAASAENLFLENDDKEVEIHVIYEAASAILGIEVEALKEMMNIFLIGKWSRLTPICLMLMKWK